MLNPSIISSEPIVMEHQDEIYPILIKKLNEILIKSESATFEFNNNNGDLIKEKYRKIYPINSIINEKELFSILIKFSKEIVPKFIKSLKDEIIDDDYKILYKEKIRYCLRLRLLEDLYGYSLQPHKDSSDTIFSFILQLNDNNIKTSLYEKGKLFKLTGNISAEPEKLKLQIASAIEKLCPNEKIFFGESQFKKNIGMWTNNKFFRYENINNWVGIQEYNEKTINSKFSNIYGISNSLTKIIYSSKLKHANEFYYHGVRPTNLKSRKLLVMDLIAQPTFADVLIMKGVNNDKNSYFMIYSPEKCSELTDLLT